MQFINVGLMKKSGKKHWQLPVWKPWPYHQVLALCLPHHQNLLLHPLCIVLLKSFLCFHEFRGLTSDDPIFKTLPKWSFTYSDRNHSRVLQALDEMNFDSHYVLLYFSYHGREKEVHYPQIWLNVTYPISALYFHSFNDVLKVGAWSSLICDWNWLKDCFELCICITEGAQELS